MNKQLPILFFMTALGLGMAHAPCAWAIPAVEYQLENQNVSTLETATLRVMVNWPASEGEYTLHLTDPQLVNLTAVRQGQSLETIRQDDSDFIRKTYTLVFKPVGAGSATIGDISILYAHNTGVPGGELTVPAFTLMIRGQPIIRRLNVYWLGAACILLLVAFLVVKRRHCDKITTQTDTQTPQAIAVEKLRLLKENPMPDMAGRVRALSLIVTQFCAEYFGPAVAGNTEMEIIQKLTGVEIPVRERERVRDFLTDLHEAKYAGIKLTEADFRRISDEILRYIEGKQIIENLTP